MTNIHRKNKKHDTNQAPKAPRVLDADTLRAVQGGSLNYSKIMY